MFDQNLMERLEALSMPEPNTGCAMWLGAFCKGESANTTYVAGLIKYKGRATKVGRAAYIAKHGPVPGGLHVLHGCDNGLCCNPDHVRLGTHAENMHDLKVRRRSRVPGTTEADRQRMREMRASGMTLRAIGKVLGCDGTTVLRFTREKE